MALDARMQNYKAWISSSLFTCVVHQGVLGLWPPSLRWSQPFWPLPPWRWSDNCAGYSPHKTQWARLSSSDRWRHAFGGVNSRTSKTRFPTNVLTRRGSPRSHPKTMRLSVHAKLLSHGIIYYCIPGLFRHRGYFAMHLYKWIGKFRFRGGIAPRRRLCTP